jgi:hypothetical protein
MAKAVTIRIATRTSCGNVTECVRACVSELPSIGRATDAERIEYDDEGASHATPRMRAAGA